MMSKGVSFAAVVVVISQICHAQMEFEKGFGMMALMGGFGAGMQGGSRGGRSMGGMGLANGGMEWLLDDPFKANRMGVWNSMLRPGGMGRAISGGGAGAAASASVGVDSTAASAKSMATLPIHDPAPLQSQGVSAQMAILPIQDPAPLQSQGVSAQMEGAQAAQATSNHNLQLQRMLAVRTIQLQQLLANQRMIQRQRHQQPRMMMNPMRRNPLFWAMLFE